MCLLCYRSAWLNKGTLIWFFTTHGGFKPALTTADHIIGSFKPFPHDFEPLVVNLKMKNKKIWKQKNKKNIITFQRHTCKGEGDSVVSSVSNDVSSISSDVRSTTVYLSAKKPLESLKK